MEGDEIVISSPADQANNQRISAYDTVYYTLWIERPDKRRLHLEGPKSENVLIFGMKRTNYVY